MDLIQSTEGLKQQKLSYLEKKEVHYTAATQKSLYYAGQRAHSCVVILHGKG